MKKDTVRTIAIIAGVLILLAIVGLGSAVWLFIRSFDVGHADAATASQQFDQIRSRFGGVTPVLDIRNHEPVVTRPPAAQSAGTRLRTLHVLAWDPDDEQLTRIDVPFWLVRLKSGPIDIAVNRGGDTELGITVEELERYGPTIVLDHAREDGERVLVWTE